MMGYLDHDDLDDDGLGMPHSWIMISPQAVNLQRPSVNRKLEQR